MNNWLPATIQMSDHQVVSCQSISYNGTSSEKQLAPACLSDPGIDIGEVIGAWISPGQEGHLLQEGKAHRE
jgi:hypothetical protein